MLPDLPSSSSHIGGSTENTITLTHWQIDTSNDGNISREEWIAKYGDDADFDA